MTNYSITWLLISIPLVAMVTSIFGLMWAGMDETFGTPADAIDISAYNKTQEISQNMFEIRNRTTTIKEEQGATDRLGNFFSNAYGILVSIPSSFELIYGYIAESLVSLPLGVGGDIISITIMTIIIIIIVVGIVLAVLLKVNP